MTHSYVWHDSFLCVTWLIPMCDMTHSYVWHDSFLCVHLTHSSNAHNNIADAKQIKQNIWMSHVTHMNVWSEWQNIASVYSYYSSGVTLGYLKQPRFVHRCTQVYICANKKCPIVWFFHNMRTSEWVCWCECACGCACVCVSVCVNVSVTIFEATTSHVQNNMCSLDTFIKCTQQQRRH